MDESEVEADEHPTLKEKLRADGLITEEQAAGPGDVIVGQQSTRSCAFDGLVLLAQVVLVVGVLVLVLRSCS